MKIGTYDIFAHGPRKGRPKTMTDRVIRYLIEGFQAKEKPSVNTTKYRVFEIPDQNKDRLYFVGKSAAVRVGKNSSNSFSITDTVHQHMLVFEKNKYPQEVW